MVEISFAFQPIVDAVGREVVAYEALIRGAQQQSAASVLAAVAPEDVPAFERRARGAVLDLAVRLGLRSALHINALPQIVADTGAAVGDLLAELRGRRVAPNQLVLEVTEHEAMRDAAAFARAVDALRSAGIRLAIDDFGAGWSGLNLLADFQPEIVKLDMALVRDVHTNGPRQAIIRGVLRTCEELGIEVIAEGVETADEYRWFRNHDVSLFQGYLFAKPAFESLPPARLPGCLETIQPG